MFCLPEYGKIWSVEISLESHVSIIFEALACTLLFSPNKQHALAKKSLNKSLIKIKQKEYKSSFDIMPKYSLPKQVEFRINLLNTCNQTSLIL